jgi:hypothetical protein
MALGNAKQVKLGTVRKSRAKSVPVGVTDPVSFCEDYMDTDEEVKAGTRKLKTMKPLLAQLVPQSGSIKKQVYAATRDDKIGAYVVTHVVSDRRGIDSTKLTELVMKKGFKQALIYQADEAAVNQLVQEGKITAQEIEACMTGLTVEYNLLTFEEIKP